MSSYLLALAVGRFDTIQVIGSRRCPVGWPLALC